MSLMIYTEKWLLNHGYVRNIYCGLTMMWAWCKVCDHYTHQYPLQESGTPNYRFVCTNCKSNSRLVS